MISHNVVSKFYLATLKGDNNVAIYIHGDGTEITLSPPKHFIYKELQNLVEGAIDIVDMGENGVLVINADYYAEGVARNEKATALALTYIPDGTYIAGPLSTQPSQKLATRLPLPSCNSYTNKGGCYE